jgi:excisionase family DNA binding protein
MPAPGLPEFLTTREVAELLRVRERRIYDMAAAGEVPCRRVTGKLLFPRGEIEAWIAGKSETAVEPEPAPIVAGSHDPLLDWALREAGTGLGSFFDGSLDGLERFADGRAVMAGTHVLEPDGVWNLGHFAARFADCPAVAIRWARRQQGLILPDGSPIAGFDDLRGRRITRRQTAAGSRVLFDHFAARAGFAEGDLKIASEVRTETEAAAEVAAGRADAALGLETAARQYGLRFVPLIEEEFDLVLWRKAYFQPPLQALWAFCRTPRFTAKVAELGGYDIAGLGEVRWLGG